MSENQQPELYHLKNCSGQESTVALPSFDVVSLSRARANFSELAGQAKAGSEKIITKNGKSYVALIDAERLDYYHRLERERIHLLLLDDIEQGLADIAAGRVRDARRAVAEIKPRRGAKKRKKVARPPSLGEVVASPRR